MRFTTSIAAAFGLVNIASAHVVMTSPVPFDAANLNNSPLDPSGSDFPCKNADYSKVSELNEITAGKDTDLRLKGSAVHGGGSCQLSITYDAKPNKDSQWKVIHTIEGGCPMVIDGNNGDNAAAEVPATHQFQIPTGLPTGPAVLAWTWFNRIGNREMYMNCAPIKINGPGVAKRSAVETFEAGVVSKLAARQNSALNSLPDMFVANIGTGCGTAEGKDLEFPSPGNSVERLTSDFGAPVGDSCPAAGAAPQAPVDSAPAEIAPIATAPVASPSPVDVAPVIPTRAAENKPVEEAPVEEAPVAEAPAPVVAEPTPSPEPKAPAQPEAPQNETAPAPEIPTVGGTTIAPGTPCPSDEGMWNCVGGSSFQRCASGQWSVVQPVAAGTTCASGISTSIKIVALPIAKREVRFSNAHVRRHLFARSF